MGRYQVGHAYRSESRKRPIQPGDIHLRVTDNPKLHREDSRNKR